MTYIDSIYTYIYSYSLLDTPYPRGEICVHTDRMIQGYYNDPHLTEGLFLERDGVKYVRTGKTSDR